MNRQRQRSCLSRTAPQGVPPLEMCKYFSRILRIRRWRILSCLPAGRSLTGFSLMELMVVIAVVIVLAGLLMPAFAKVRSFSRRTQCANNLKQIGIALHLYAANNNGDMPLYESMQAGWTNDLSLYLDDENIFDCPAVPGVGSISNPDYWLDTSDAGDLITESSWPIAGCFSTPHDGLENKVCVDGRVICE